MYNILSWVTLVTHFCHYFSCTATIRFFTMRKFVLDYFWCSFVNKMPSLTRKKRIFSTETEKPKLRETNLFGTRKKLMWTLDCSKCPKFSTTPQVEMAFHLANNYRTTESKNVPKCHPWRKCFLSFYSKPLHRRNVHGARSRPEAKGIYIEQKWQ